MSSSRSFFLSNVSRFYNNHFITRSLVLLSACAVSYHHKCINYDNYNTKCDEIIKKEEEYNSNENTIKINLNDIPTSNNHDTNKNISIDDDDDSAWEAEKQSCSFCRQFLQSPCKLPFKNWSKCVDKAKVDNTDFVTECSQYTSALMTCTSDNAEYFNAIFSQQNNDEDEDDDTDGDDSSQNDNSNKNINTDSKQ